MMDTSTPATNPIYANRIRDDGITMTENPAYTTHVDGIIMENTTSATKPVYANETSDDIAMTENPAYVMHLYAQVYPLSSPDPDHQSSYNTSDFPGDCDYI